MGSVLARHRQPTVLPCVQWLGGGVRVNAAHAVVVGVQFLSALPPRTHALPSVGPMSVPSPSAARAKFPFEFAMLEFADAESFGERRRDSDEYRMVVFVFDQRLHERALG